MTPEIVNIVNTSTGEGKGVHVRVYDFGGVQVRVPHGWDRVKVGGYVYLRRRDKDGRHRYWVREGGWR